MTKSDLQDLSQLIQQYYLLQEMHYYLSNKLQITNSSRYQFLTVMGVLQSSPRSSINGVEVILLQLNMNGQRCEVMVSRQEYFVNLGPELSELNHSPTKSTDIVCFSNVTPRLLSDSRVVYLLRNTSGFRILKNKLGHIQTAHLNIVRMLSSVLARGAGKLEYSRIETGSYRGMATDEVILEKVLNDPVLAKRCNQSIICGVLEVITDTANALNQSSMTDSASNRNFNEKSVTIALYQHLDGGKGYGYYKVIIKCTSLKQEQELLSTLHNGYLYAVVSPQLKVTSSGDILYTVQLQKSSRPQLFVFKLFSSEPWPIPIAYREQHLLKVQPVSCLSSRHIDRNIHKFHVLMLDLHSLHVSFLCSQCGRVRGHNCDLRCKTTEGKLDIWAIVETVDRSEPRKGKVVNLSLKTQVAVEFLELDPDMLDELRDYCFQARQRVTITLRSGFEKKTIKQKQLLRLLTHLRECSVEKVVTGIAYIDFRKTFREGLSADKKMEYQSAAQGMKEYVSLNGVNPNGGFEKEKVQPDYKNPRAMQIQQAKREVPFLKVRRVFKLTNQLMCL